MSTFKTTPSGAINFIENAYKARLPIFVWGSPGVGKSDSARQAAKNLGVDLIDIRASQFDPVDLRGIPFKNKNDQTAWATPEFLPQDPDWKGIIFADELNSSAQSVQAAFYQLILDRQLGEYKLPEGAIVIAAGNKDSDRGVTNRMPTPLRNRFASHVEVEVNLDEWVEWAIQSGIDPLIVSYLKYKPDNLYRFDPKSDDKAFATPRSWSFLDKWLKQIGNTPELSKFATSCVGAGVAADLAAYANVISKLPDIDKILQGKDVKFDHTDPAVCYGLAASVGHRMDKTNAKNAVAFLQNKLSPEYGVMGVKYALTKDSSLMTDKTIIEWAKKNKNIFLK